ncbi:hypothetical protein [Pelagibius sp. Alg239-R121]|uniref:hypothetical protein n=1 Tax=Pelagibius sp. Alg239-R121 TaxID=2993448 RepID=UPI0024A71782|nr:hypothetical protein [Pelagibius sp. Alg239-R121]
MFKFIASAILPLLVASQALASYDIMDRVRANRSSIENALVYLYELATGPFSQMFLVGVVVLVAVLWFAFNRLIGLVFGIGIFSMTIYGRFLDSNAW